MKATKYEGRPAKFKLCPRELAHVLLMAWQHHVLGLGVFPFVFSHPTACSKVQTRLFWLWLSTGCQIRLLTSATAQVL